MRKRSISGDGRFFGGGGEREGEAGVTETFRRATMCPVISVSSSKGGVVKVTACGLSRVPRAG